MIFHQKTRNTVKNKYHPVRAEPPDTVKSSKRSTGCTRQDLERERSILLSITHKLSLCVSQVCHGVSSCVKDWSCCSSSLE